MDNCSDYANTTGWGDDVMRGELGEGGREGGGRKRGREGGGMEGGREGGGRKVVNLYPPPLCLCGTS